MSLTKLLKQELSIEEQKLIEKHRNEKVKLKNAELFRHTVFNVANEWEKYSDSLGGVGFTFSTFCSDGEFGVNKYLDESMMEYRKWIFELIGEIKNIIYNKSTDLFL